MRMDKVRLVAGREVAEGVRTKSYRVATAVMALVAIVAVTVPHAIAHSDKSRTHVGVVGELAVAERALLIQVAHGDGTTIDFKDLAGRPEAERALRRGTVALAIVDRQEVLLRRALAPGDASPQSRLATTLSVLLALRTTGPAPINALEPAAPAQRSAADRFTGYTGVLFIFVFILTYGMWVANGVTDEKTNRLVEVLLAPVRPVELLVGKVGGIGLLAVAQAAVIGAVAFIAALATGASVVRNLTGRMTLVVLGWFVLAYAFYGLAYAAAASTVGRQEDVRSVGMPLMIPLMAGYLVPIGAVSTGQDSAVLRFMSFFPPTAPMAMTMRLGLGTVSLSEVAISVALMLLTIAATAAGAARIYRNSILRTGKRVRFRDAWRTSAGAHS